MKGISFPRLFLYLSPSHVAPVLVVLVVVWVYYFSIFHVPRADHIIFLSFTGAYDHFWELLPDVASYSRVTARDGFIFRPLFFLFHAISEAVFGRTNFAAYQAIAIMLHLLVVLYLFHVINKHSGWLLGAGISLFFGVLFVSQEAVAWSHETPLVLATFLSIYAIIAASRLLADEARVAWAASVLALFLANLIHEITLALGPIIFVVLLIYAGRSVARRAALFLLPAATYLLVNYLDQLRFQATVNNPIKKFVSQIDILGLADMAYIFFHSAWHWIYAGFFPQAVHMTFEGRVFYHTGKSLNVAESLTRYPFQTLASLLLVCTILASLFYTRRGGDGGDQAFAQTGFVRDTSMLAALSMMGLLVVGRYDLISNGGYFSVLTYYSYIFMGLLTLFIWGVIAPVTVQTTGTTADHYPTRSARHAFLMVFILSLTVVTVANGEKTRMITKDGALKSAGMLSLVEGIDDFIEDHYISSQRKFRVKTRVNADENINFVDPRKAFYMERGLFGDRATLFFTDIIYMSYLEMDESADAVPLTLGKRGNFINFDTDKGERLVGVDAVDTVGSFNIFSCSDGGIVLQSIRENFNLFPCFRAKLPRITNLKHQLETNYLQSDGVSIVETSGADGINRKSVGARKLIGDSDFWEYAGRFPVALEVTFTQQKELSGYILGTGFHQPEAMLRAPKSWRLYARESTAEAWSEISRSETDGWSPNETKVIALKAPVRLNQLKLVIDSTFVGDVLRLYQFRPLFSSS